MCVRLIPWVLCCRQGARFTKWRAALKVSDTLPSQDAIEQNAKDLATYASICQVLSATRKFMHLVCSGGMLAVRLLLDNGRRQSTTTLTTS